MIGSEGPDSVQCSRAGCREPALLAVNWRNPRIHSADRVKIWLACEPHSHYLAEYLAARDFPVIVTPLGVVVESVVVESVADARGSLPNTGATQ